ncbi:uncharacterized protein LOC126586349 isoform X2 [Malus sylvestris]|uniref:uncharacterized protein LOC126586349 isoform X2 n=1 Tax=Malus sylvestris TaxID=3752 RepID=UPI0021ACC948|nr:uncharacterized protein LOC126586349 isoform X2 [Malus sylvestris]
MSSSPREKPSPATESLSEQHESVLRLEEDEGEDEDEEEDVDFNPFLKGTLSPEASSSLSSDVEVLDGEVVDSSRNTIETARINSLIVACEAQKCSVGDPEHGEEETVMQTAVSPDGASANEFEKTARNSNSEAVQEKDDVSSGETDVNDAIVGELSNTEDVPKPTVDLDDEDEDAICKRTRARYSLASFTLDELETFLQETDDEDDLQNVNDEEEYRKFLTAVLQGEGDEQSTKENENADDEDEDNDADFEIELEELLESDGDENTRDKSVDENGEAGRRPKTRQNKCHKEPAQCKKKNLGQTKRPLRPLLPVLPKGPMSCFSNQAGRTLMRGTASSCLSSTVSERSINGFTAHQIGQLHCLIHEHVQLLIQVFSLCALDYSRQHIASQVKKLISEMLQKRDEVLIWKNVPYPTVCFFPSVPTEFPNSYTTQSSLASSLTFDALRECSLNNHMAVSPNISPSNSRSECVPNGQVGISQNIGGSFWVPSVSGPVLSVLDVAPLSLVGRYMDEVNTAVQENRRCFVETSSDTRLEKEPLFPFSNFQLGAQANCESVSGTGSSASNVAPSSSSQRPPKKSLAATIVESTKKQSLALVPKDISKLAQGFFPLFNPALFPYKPPTGAVANRILFTDAEDELLALGMMEHNTDWKAIQQRFLPCKTKHQDCQAEKSGGENSADGLTDNNAGETYVHEAFLADWRPGTSCVERNPHSGTLSQGAIHEWVNVFGQKEAPQTQTVSQYPHGQSQITGVRHFTSSTTPANHSVSQLYYRPYRARRTNGAQLVKLAPQLPPVNLPPSVRVVSQSAFRGSLRGASSTVSASGGSSGAAATHNLFSQPSKAGRFGTSDAITASHTKSSSLKDTVSTLCPEDSRIIQDKCVEEGRDVDSDLQMHPLLFQAPEDGRLPYFPLNCRNSNSSTFSFHSANQPQLHLSLFHNPHQGNHVDGFDKSLKTPNSTSRAIDFHPLMQRTDCVSSATVTTYSTAPLSVGSGGNHSQDQYPSDTGRLHLPVNADSRSMGTNEKANELDLEIHLSSTSKKEKPSKRRDVAANNSIRSRTMAPEMITQCANSPLLRQAENSSANGSELVIPSNDISRYSIDDIGDQSQHDIQMEQEELSDSDEENEENEENVEFECEEMTDSEGEGGSACEEVAEMQNKDVPTHAMKRPATTDPDGKECEPNATYHPQDNIHRIPNLDDASNSSWLSLDSCAPDRPPHMMSKYDESTMDSSFSANDSQSSRPLRSCKKAKLSTREGATPKQAVDMTHQLSLGPPSNPMARKPRKRVSRTSTCLNIGLTVENSGSDG